LITKVLTHSVTDTPRCSVRVIVIDGRCGSTGRNVTAGNVVVSGDVDADSGDEALPWNDKLCHLQIEHVDGEWFGGRDAASTPLTCECTRRQQRRRCTCTRRRRP
jgi:hypothetical protein